MTYINKNSSRFNPNKLWTNNEEKKYLAVMEDILVNGIERNDRTNIGTISQFGISLKYDLKDTFPSTSKKCF